MLTRNLQVYVVLNCLCKINKFLLTSSLNKMSNCNKYGDKFIVTVTMIPLPVTHRVFVFDVSCNSEKDC